MPRLNACNPNAREKFQPTTGSEKLLDDGSLRGNLLDDVTHPLAHLQAEIPGHFQPPDGPR